MDTTSTYYNAKPSNISNLGKDVSGAKRMNFDTYETTEERETRKRKNASDKEAKEALKAAVLAESPDRELIKKLLDDQFILRRGFSTTAESCRSIIMDRRREVRNDTDRKNFNALVSDFNRTITQRNNCESDYRFRRMIQTMRKRYAPKDSFIGQSGETFNWKEFSQVNDVSGQIEFLKANSTAVQFGNSVSDKERGYILNELSAFIKDWQSKELTAKADITPISWSFGARGNSQSVAYYQHFNRVISVNRNNIGSLIHEIGHFLDYRSGEISHRMSYATVAAYAESLPSHIVGAERRYYCSRVEIFARAFEAYCYAKRANFSKFAQTGKGFLPVLNDELIALVEKSLGL